MANTLLNEDIKKQVLELFETLDKPVSILFFGREEDCDYCNDTQQLAEEVSALSERLELHIYNLDEHSDIAAQYNVDKTPSLVIAGGNGSGPIDYGIRFAGIPSGHEFTSLIQDIVLVSNGDSGLNDKTREFLKNLAEPVHMQVFVTPSCPYCPRAVVLAHQMAMESPMVQAEMIEATEFPELSNKYQIMGVPDTSINHGNGRVVGAVPEFQLMAEIENTLKK